MSFRIKFSNRAFRVLSGYLRDVRPESVSYYMECLFGGLTLSDRMIKLLQARWVPPILETGFKSGLFITYAQSNAQEKPLSITQVEIPGMGDVTHRSLIKQACAGSLETSSQLLTFTVNAFIDVSGRYRAAVQRHAGLMTELMDPGVSDFHRQRLWDSVVDARLESQELRTSLLELAGLMDRVTKLAAASAEVSFLAGAEFVSSSMCERISCVSREFQKECDSNKAAEDDLLKVQAQFVKHSPERATQTES